LDRTHSKEGQLLPKDHELYSLPHEEYFEGIVEIRRQRLLDLSAKRCKPQSNQWYFGWHLGRHWATARPNRVNHFARPMLMKVRGTMRGTSQRSGAHPESRNPKGWANIVPAQHQHSTAPKSDWQSASTDRNPPPTHTGTGKATDHPKFVHRRNMSSRILLSVRRRDREAQPICQQSKANAKSLMKRRMPRRTLKIVGRKNEPERPITETERGAVKWF
jgi:hypothetical protein